MEHLNLRSNDSELVTDGVILRLLDEDEDDDDDAVSRAFAAELAAAAEDVICVRDFN